MGWQQALTSIKKQQVLQRTGDFSSVCIPANKVSHPIALYVHACTLLCKSIQGSSAALTELFC